MLDTIIIDDQAGLENLRIEWDRLLQQNRTNTIFMTWEWASTWWEVFGHGAKLFIITVRNEAGQLVGLAPLCVRRSRYYAFPVREMTFLGAGHADRQDFLISADVPVAGDVLSGIMSALQQHGGEWDVVQLDQIPEESLLVSLGTENPCHGELERSSHCSYVRIDGAWDAYLKSLSRKFRKDVRNKTNNLNRLGNWELVVTSDVSDFDACASVMSTIESKSRKNNTEKAFWTQDGNREFLKRFASRAATHQWVDFTTLCLKGAPIAHLLGFVYNGTYSAYNTAYLDEYFDVSPGKLVIHEKIKWCFDHGAAIGEFDFLRGDFYIKSLWASDGRQHRRMVLFMDTLYSKMLKFAVFSVRPLLKRIRTLGRRSDSPVVPEAE